MRFSLSVFDCDLVPSSLSVLCVEDFVRAPIVFSFLVGFSELLSCAYLQLFVGK